MTTPNPVPASQRQSLAVVMQKARGQKRNSTSSEPNSAGPKNAPLASAVAQTNARLKRY